MFRTDSIAQTVERIKSQELDPLDLLQQCLDRIAWYEGQVRAWVVVDDQRARKSAQKIRDDLAQGRPVGPLAGIPVGVKDVMDVEGLPTRAGSQLRECHLAAIDAPLVASLRRAGAVILGKTVTVEFACFDPPPTRNPWTLALDHTPGGSSSGSAVAVALGMCLAATGTQTGGSLVRPASYCGVAAFKPTFGRISLEGVVPVSFHLDHMGAIAPSAADLEAVLEPVFGVAKTEGEASYAAETHLRLGLIQEFMDQADEPVRRAIEEALDRLGDSGARVEPARLGLDFDEIRAMHRRIMAVEAAAYHRPAFSHSREAYGPKIASLLDEGLAISAVDFAEALAHQRELRRTIDTCIGSFDALVMPATNTTAPASADTTGDPKFQSPWSYAGTPAVSLPCGLAADGLPAAIQLVARWGEDRRLLRIARWCEQSIEFDAHPPLVDV